MEYQLKSFGYESTAFLQELVDELGVYLPNKVADIRMKPKYEQRLRKECRKPFALQMDAIVFIKDIEICHMLGQNEVVIDDLVSDYKNLRLCLTDINKELARLKQFKELNDHLPKYDAAYTKKCLYDDLTTLKERFNLEFDVKEQMK